MKTDKIYDNQTIQMIFLRAVLLWQVIDQNIK
jgi:hypothetical protein